MKKKITITYNWWCNSNPKEDIPSDIQSDLEESAEERITEMSAEGFTSGQLLATLTVDGEDVDFQGHWERATETE